MMRIVRENFKPVLAILGLATISFGIAYYILQQQFFRFPWEADPVKMYAVLETAQAVTPGQGQPVQVSGVRIGRVGTVKLEDGRARLTLEIEQGNEGLIKRDARAMLRPRTPLKDMYLQIFPGSDAAPEAKAGFTIPVSDTRTDVNPDEILAELDERTRDYLVLLAEGTGRGLKGKGDDLAEVFERFGPTMEDLASVTEAVGQEHRALRRLVSSVARLNGELARNPEDLTQLVDASAATMSAFAAEDERLRESLDELPPTLRRATRTLNEIRPFARELRPTANALVPAVRELDDANEDLRPFARAATPIVREEIRPFAREARPLVRDLVPAAQSLSRTMPELTRSGRVANRFFNMLASNPNGSEGPDQQDREEGYLFWLGWLFHQTTNLQNIEDANGPIRPIFLTGTCATLTSFVEDNPAAELGFGLSSLLTTVCGNPSTASESLQAIQDLLPDGLLPDSALPGPLKRKAKP